MCDATFAIPGDLETPTGGYVYDRRIMALLPRHGIAVRHLRLPGSFPDPTAADLALTVRLLAEFPADAALVIDGLAYGTLPAEAVVPLGRRIVALVHHPLCLESGLSPERARTLFAGERTALRIAARTVVTSPTTARWVIAEFGLAPDRVAIVEPGTDPAPRARRAGSPPLLLAVGAASPRKGHDVLIAALTGLAGQAWRVVIAGSLTRDPGAASALRDAITASGLESRILLAGAVDDDRLAALYAEADLFVMPSLHEGYGMALAEAIARGLPIVTTTGGAAAETVPDSAALKVPPGDAMALRQALARALGDPDLRRRMADASWAAAQRLPRWDDAAGRFAKILAGVAP